MLSNTVARGITAVGQMPCCSAEHSSQSGSSQQLNVSFSWSHASRLALLLPPLGQRSPPRRCVLLILAAAVALLLLLLLLSLLLLIILGSSGAVLFFIQLPPPAERSKYAAAGCSRSGKHACQGMLQLRAMQRAM